MFKYVLSCEGFAATTKCTPTAVAHRRLSPQETHAVIIHTFGEKHSLFYYGHLHLAAFLCRADCMSYLQVDTGVHHPSCLLS